MKILLHNKFEIKIRDKLYTAYNTLLKTVYEKIANLEQYTSHIAVGTGLNMLTFNDTKLTSYLKTFKTTTEEIQSDVSKGTLFIRKLATIEESDTSTFSFSELGLTNTSDFDPIIFNHVLLTDTDGNPVSVTRNEGDAMEIRVTIYLELTTQSDALFTTGENKLIKQILGEDLSLSDSNLYALRGENLSENKYIGRATPDLSNAAVCDKKIEYDDEAGSIEITFKAKLGEGAIEELLVCFGEQIVLRLNTLELKPAVSTSATLTCNQGNTIEVDKYVKSITSVTKQSDGSLEESYSVTKYGKKLTDKLLNVFDQPFNYLTPRFISKDGQSICFIYDSYVHLYKYADYSFTKVNTTQVPANDIYKIFLNDNFFVMLQTSKPYVRVFKIENNIATEQKVVTLQYENSAFDYNWISADAIFLDSGKILLGLVVNNDDNTPLVLELYETTEGYYDNLYRLQLPTAKVVYAINKNPFSEPRLGFITDTYEGETNYFLEEYLESGSNLQSSSEIPFTLLNDNQKLMTAGRAVLSQKSIYPYLYVYYYPEFNTASEYLSSGIMHYASYDGNYLVAKYEDSTYKIFNFHVVNQLTEFETGFPEFILQDEILDIDFIGDMMLVFSSNNDESVYAVAIKNAYTRIDNTSDQSASYIINYEKYDLYGTKNLEGVMTNLNLKFSGSES